MLFSAKILPRFITALTILGSSLSGNTLNSRFCIASTAKWVFAPWERSSSLSFQVSRNPNADSKSSQQHPTENHAHTAIWQCVVWRPGGKGSGSASTIGFSCAWRFDLLFLEGLTLTFGCNQLSLLFHPQLELQTEIFLHVEFVKSYYINIHSLIFFEKLKNPWLPSLFLLPMLYNQNENYIGGGNSIFFKNSPLLTWGKSSNLTCAYFSVGKPGGVATPCGRCLRFDAAGGFRIEVPEGLFSRNGFCHWKEGRKDKETSPNMGILTEIKE